MARKPVPITAAMAQQEQFEALKEQRTAAYARLDVAEAEYRVAQKEAQAAHFDLVTARERMDIAAKVQHDADVERVRKAELARKEVKRAELREMGVPI
jgi:hypothetical protein